MIELTEQQMQALDNTESTPPRIVNPRTKETFVLLRVDEYKRLKDNEYDDSPWTREELQALAWEAGKQADRTAASILAGIAALPTSGGDPVQVRITTGFFVGAPCSVADSQ